jgi:hypothetical protein
MAVGKRAWFAPSTTDANRAFMVGSLTRRAERFFRVAA